MCEGVGGFTILDLRSFYGQSHRITAVSNQGFPYRRWGRGNFLGVCVWGGGGSVCWWRGDTDFYLKCSRIELRSGGDTDSEAVGDRHRSGGGQT